MRRTFSRGSPRSSVFKLRTVEYAAHPNRLGPSGALQSGDGVQALCHQYARGDRGGREAALQFGQQCPFCPASFQNDPDYHGAGCSPANLPLDIPMEGVLEFLWSVQRRPSRAEEDGSPSGNARFYGPSDPGGFRPLHGYGIARRIGQVSESVLQLNEGTVYTALLRLQQQGSIRSEWGVSENNRRAKFYCIT